MLAQKAGAAGTAPRNNRQDESYTHPGRVSIKLERERKMAERRAQIPNPTTLFWLKIFRRRADIFFQNLLF